MDRITVIARYDGRKEFCRWLPKRVTIEDLKRRSMDVFGREQSAAPAYRLFMGEDRIGDQMPIQSLLEGESDSGADRLTRDLRATKASHATAS